MAHSENSHKSIVEDVRAYLREYFMLFPSMELTPDTSLIESGTIDSTGAAELVAYLENRYDFTILDEEFVPDNLDSIAKIAAFVSRKLGVPSAQSA